MKTKGVTSEGFAYELAENAGDDMEVLEALKELEGGDIYQVSYLLDKLLGKEQKKALYDFYREKEGRVSIVRMSEVMKGFFAAEDASKELKNS